MPALSGNWPWWTESVPSALRRQPYESPDARRAKFDERDGFHQYCSVCRRETLHKLGSIHRDAHGERKSYVCQEHAADMEGTLLPGAFRVANIFGGHKRGGKE